MDIKLKLIVISILIAASLGAYIFLGQKNNNLNVETEISSAYECTKDSTTEGCSQSAILNIAPSIADNAVDLLSSLNESQLQDLNSKDTSRTDGFVTQSPPKMSKIVVPESQGAIKTTTIKKTR